MKIVTAWCSMMVVKLLPVNDIAGKLKATRNDFKTGDVVRPGVPPDEAHELHIPLFLR